MMKLFLLSLLIAASYGNSLITTLCTTSTDCSGDDCTAGTPVPIPVGCVSGTISTCEDNVYKVTTYTSTDCTGDGEVVNYEIGECYPNSLTGVGSFKYECSDSAMKLSLLFVSIMVFIVSLFQ